MDFRKINKNVTRCLSPYGTAPRYILFLLIVCLALMEPLRGRISRIFKSRRSFFSDGLILLEPRCFADFDILFSLWNLGEVPLMLGIIQHEK